jgi:aspartokinase-like uncharacterized kinase
VETGEISLCLARVARLGRPAVIVPGGGPFADRVREAQRRDGFSDAEAHRRAILAMHEMARHFSRLEPALVCAGTLSGIRAALSRGRVPVWLPWRLCARDETIPRDWSITSDGLAARLAERLGHAPVVLVKPVRVLRSARASRLVADGVVDPTFASIVRRSGLSWSVARAGPASLTHSVDAALGAHRRRRSRMLRPTPWQKKK